MTKFSAGVGALLVLLASFTAQRAGAAQADPLMVQVIAEDWPSLARDARQRLAADPMDGAALHALGRVAIDSQMGSEGLRQSVLAQAQACIAARPADALCQLAYGQVQGALLNEEGGLSALAKVGKVQRAFELAVASAPRDYDARESLVTFYLRAPGIVGGSMRKAHENADAYGRADAERARLLYALIDLQEEDPGKAEHDLAGLPQEIADEDLNRLIANRWLAIAQAYLEAHNEGAAIAAFQHALPHGAPSVAVAARQALDGLGVHETAQAGGGGEQPAP